MFLKAMLAEDVAPNRLDKASKLFRKSSINWEAIE
jgi:hypothetical protein